MMIPYQYIDTRPQTHVENRFGTNVPFYILPGKTSKSATLIFFPHRTRIHSLGPSAHRLVFISSI